MSNYPFTLNGNTYAESSFTGFGYVTALPNALADLVREILLQHAGTSSSSITVGTGAKSFTTQTGRAWRSGDLVTVASSATPTTRMVGTVTTYVFATGAMNINVLSVYGSGTLSSWNVCLAGVPTAQVNDNMLTIDNGGTGFRSSNFAQPGAMLGIGEPSCMMCELVEDFAGSQGGTTSADTSGTIYPPWQAFGISGYQPYLEGASSTAQCAGTFNLKSLTTVATSSILVYGFGGFLHAGRGGIIYESNLYNAFNGGNYALKFGLASQAAGIQRNIFAGGGIGFEATKGVNNGRYVLVCGTNGVVQRLNTQYLPSTTTDAFRIETDHDGLNADFYINGNYCGRLSNILPTTDPQALMHPAYETQPIPITGGGYTQTSYYIDSVWVRKYLLR